MTVPLVTEPPTPAPNRNQEQAVFSPLTDATLAWQVVGFPEMNVSFTQLNADFEAANALNQSTADLANTIVNASNFVGEWDNLTGALNVPSTVFHDGIYWQLLINLADVTSSEPALVNSDWALSPQVSDRVVIQSPLTLTITGRYFILGSGIISLPNPSTFIDGQSWDFAREKGGEPTVEVAPATDVFKFDGYPDDDGVIMDSVDQLELIVRNGFYEV